MSDTAREKDREKKREKKKEKDATEITLNNFE